MSRTLHAGWFRCRLKGKDKQWIYYQVMVTGSQRELFREARYWAGLWLRRQVFDVERVVAKPDNLTTTGSVNFTIDGLARTQQFFHEGFPVSPEPELPEAGKGDGGGE